VVYPSDFEQKTGFDAIRRLVAGKCLSALGEECVDGMAFSPDYRTIHTLLEQTVEFVRILHGDAEFPVDYFFDVRRSLQHIRPEGTWMDGKELFDLKRSLQTLHDIVRFLRPPEGEEAASPSYPHLSALAGDVQTFPQLTGKIENILDKAGGIKDNASPELARIRKEMAATVNGISRTLRSILRSAQSEGLIDKDVTPAMRDGRLMIPVAPAYRRKIKGIVHDESATGKTVFIEPESIVEANNRIRELEGEEKREIIRILTLFADTLRPLIPGILHAYAFLARIDFIRAKALFAEETGGVKPVLEEGAEIDWFHAVHPLLYLSHRKQGREVVPLDLSLNREKRLLIISGPNAGGKSVCLKTAGLLQYMLQCGLLIPLYENSHAGIFTHIFIDIGDEQSIENDLSTYSSHLTNMKFFVRNCNETTLLLIDEFGSGTEPQIGGAIAEALLDRFNRKRSFGIITTHYRNLKHFAEETEGVVNGAMLYDRHLMQPLFKLSVGNPGSSFAIEIARKIGLPEEVIADASAKVGTDYIDMDKYLQDIVRDKRYWETKRQQIHRQEKKLEEITAQYEQDLAEAGKQRKEIIREAKEEALRILAEANARIEHTVREIKEAQAEKEQTKTARKALEEFKASVVSIAEGKEPAAPRKAAKTKERREAIAVGDNVRLKGQNAAGAVIELQGKQAVVAFGMIKSTVKLEQLEKVSKGQIKRDMREASFLSSQTAGDIHEKRLNFKQELDVRGMRAEEALQAVTYFIDDAILANASKVRILHGTGGGILRQVIREYLHTVPGIQHYHDEHVQFGGAGITVVELE
jgi:DNA mismatch repair protein MutS2